MVDLVALPHKKRGRATLDAPQPKRPAGARRPPQQQHYHSMPSSTCRVCGRGTGGGEGLATASLGEGAGLKAQSLVTQDVRPGRSAG